MSNYSEWSEEELKCKDSAFAVIWAIGGCLALVALAILFRGCQPVLQGG